MLQPRRPVQGSDRRGEVIERNGQPLADRHLDGRSEARAPREIRRCLKRAVARQLFKLLERYDPGGVQLVSVA
jgi:hypothetical protein